MKQLNLCICAMLICSFSFAQFFTQYNSSINENVNGQCVLNYGNNILLIASEGEKVTLAELDKTNGTILRTRTILAQDQQLNHPEIVAAMVDSDGKIMMCGYYEGKGGKTAHVFMRFDFENDFLYYARYLYETEDVYKYDVKNVVSVSEDIASQTYLFTSRTAYTFQVNKGGYIIRSGFLGNQREFVLYGNKADGNNNYMYGAWIKQSYSSRYPVLIKAKGKEIVFAKTILGDTAQTLDHFYGSISQLLVTNKNIYAAITYSNSNVEGGADNYIVKLDKDGNSLWAKQYAFELADQSRQIYTMNALPGGDILASGTSSSGTTFLMRLDSSGNIKWSNYYNFAVDNMGEYQSSLTRQYALVNGTDVFLTGNKQSGFSVAATLLNVKTSNGIIPGCYTALDITVTGIANNVTELNTSFSRGYTESTNITRAAASTALQQNAAFNCATVATAANTETNIVANEIKVYPNPATNYLHVQLQQDGIKYVSIYNMQGKSLNSLSTTANNISIPLQQYKAGSYILKITTAKGEVLVNKIFVKQ